MTRRGLVLKLLRDSGERGVTTAEFMEAGCGSRYGARIRELREQGNRIEARRVRDGSWRYWLRHDAGVGTGGAAAPHTHASPDSGDAPPNRSVAPPRSASFLAAAGQPSLFDPDEA